MFGGIRQRANTFLDLCGFWRGRPATMTEGPGTGLRFDAGRSNPDYLSGENELPVLEAVAASLQAGGVFYDIGANVGYFSVIAARLVGPQGMVLAFEPLTDNSRFIRRNARLNRFRNLEIFQFAVADSCSFADFCVTEYSGGSVLALADHRAPDVERVVRVPTVTIDHLIFERGFKPPSVIKIDVEGAEAEVLEGMRRCLAIHRPVVIYEIDDIEQKYVDRKQNKCDAILNEAGYHLQRLEDSYLGSRWLVRHTMAIPPVVSDG